SPSCYVSHRVLHSFPTRRSSDLLDATHMEGRLKAEIISDPDRFVILDEETTLALLDQKYAGKKLLLITNSEWGYTVPMMSYAFEDRKSTRLNSSHVKISYAVFCL